MSDLIGRLPIYWGHSAPAGLTLGKLIEAVSRLGYPTDVKIEVTAAQLGDLARQVTSVHQPEWISGRIVKLMDIQVIVRSDLPWQADCRVVRVIGWGRAVEIECLEVHHDD